MTHHSFVTSLVYEVVFFPALSAWFTAARISKKIQRIPHKETDFSYFSNKVGPILVINGVITPTSGVIALLITGRDTSTTLNPYTIFHTAQEDRITAQRPFPRKQPVNWRCPESER